MTLALELAARARALEFGNLPEDAVRWAKLGILDTVGVTLAGSTEPAVRLLSRAIGSGTGSSLVLGTGKRLAALDATLINGTAAHVLDFDDCNNTFGGHPSAPLVPALLALAGEADCSGRQFIAAYVAGFEMECKIARGDNYYQYARGWHPTATMGVFGAATACAHLLGLDAERMAIALAIAASLASGIKANFGTMTKPLHVGHCARSGLLAAVLARDGFTANPEALEHAQGYFQAFNGPGNYQLPVILESWGRPLDIVTPGIAFKQYPCCGSTHPPIDALLMLMDRSAIEAEQIDHIDCYIHEFCLKHTDRPAPRSGAEAKFSLQYCLARSAVSRAVTLGHFAEDSIRDPPVRQLMGRIRVAPYTAAQFPLDNYFGAEVRVGLRDGRTLTGKVEQPLGCTSDNPLPPGVLRSKFFDCAGRVCSRQRAEQAWEAGLSLDGLDSIRSFMALLEADHPPAAAD